MSFAPNDRVRVARVDLGMDDRVNIPSSALVGSTGTIIRALSSDNKAYYVGLEGRPKLFMFYEHELELL